MKSPGQLIPYRARRVHRWYAAALGYFWHPCPSCGLPFGGHEVTEATQAVYPDGGHTGHMLCPPCSQQATTGGAPSCGAPSTT